MSRAYKMETTTSPAGPERVELTLWIADDAGRMQEAGRYIVTPREAQRIAAGLDKTNPKPRAK